ncbi:MAG: hypothetical protein OHK0053_32800 [Microscillaceae bacterium]
MKKQVVLIFLLVASSFSCLFGQSVFVPEEGMLALNKQKGKVTLKVGQKAYFQAEVHASTGLGAEAQVGDAQILGQADPHMGFNQPQERA